MEKNKRRLGINHGLLHDTVDMKALIEAQAGVVVRTEEQKAITRTNGAKVKRKGYVRINQPKK